MKSYLKKNSGNLVFVALFIAFVIASYIWDIPSGKAIVQNNLLQFLKEMVVFLPFMFILIGLADVWISKEKVEKHIGHNSGIKGSIYVILLSMLQAGPLYGAFPVTYLLWKKGASIRNIFIYLGAFSTLKIPMLMFEVGFLGLKFSLLRTLVTLPVIISIAIIMEKYLKNKDFKVKDV
ncbi:MAG TPA: permease [Bacteroidales bacterium]|nr:permease [Bacteroidales bacterium]